MRYNTMIQLVLSISSLLVLIAILFARLQSREMPQNRDPSSGESSLQSTELDSPPDSLQGSASIG